MTGTIDLSRDQLQAIHNRVFDVERNWLVRVVIHPSMNGDRSVKVETSSLAGGDLLYGYFHVMRDGVILSGHDYEAARATA